MSSFDKHAVIALVGILLAVPPAAVIIWKCCTQRSKQSRQISMMNPSHNINSYLLPIYNLDRQMKMDSILFGEVKSRISHTPATYQVTRVMFIEEKALIGLP
ncbi:hypothetical protein QBC44DRAFT_335091 [Cladorrhinum sp. PSN332]|nr:hypothetical protein QBC44DRAFT_335091 [Cladorrhinum sp. PSN332]